MHNNDASYPVRHKCIFPSTMKMYQNDARLSVHHHLSHAWGIPISAYGYWTLSPVLIDIQVNSVRSPVGEIWWSKSSSILRRKAVAYLGGRAVAYSGGKAVACSGGTSGYPAPGKSLKFCKKNFKQGVRIRGRSRRKGKISTTVLGQIQLLPCAASTSLLS